MNIIEEFNDLKNNDNGSKILILCMLGIVAIIIIAIYLLISIWKPEPVNDNTKNENNKEETSQVSTKIGTYSNKVVKEDENIVDYSENINNGLFTSNIDYVYSITSPEYLSYFNLDKEGLKQLLIQKGMYGKSLEMSSYVSKKLNNNRIFRINVKSDENGLIDDSINIIENSPNNYKIAFDRFLHYDKEPIEYIREELKITISEKAVFDTLLKVRLSITNTTDNSVVINQKQSYECIYLNAYGEKTYTPSVSPISSRIITIEKGSTFNFNLTFNIDDLSADKIKEIKLKDVTVNKTGVNTDILIPLK